MNKLPAVLSVLGLSIITLSAKAKTTTAGAKLAYHLSWDGKSSVLKVSLEYTAASKDSTVFIYGEPNFGGQTEIFKVLQNMTADGPDKLKLTPKDRKITVYHVGAGVKRINYEINGQLVGNPKRATVDELFRPLITQKVLYLLPRFFMINPIDQGAAMVSIQWDSFPPGLPYFISTAAGSAPSVKQTIPVKKEDEVLMLMGPDLVIDKYEVHHIPYYSITSKSDTINNLKTELAPFFNRYFPDLRDFWKDDQSPYYYICILPLLSIDKPWATGFGWGHGFVMKYSGKFDDNKKRVLAHETSHSWIGNGMQIGNDEFDNQWFGEGFNDYVMLINMVKSGISGKDSFLSYVNKDNLLAHYSSPAKSVPNDSIAAKFWTDKNYQVLPYKRGFIYAFYLDNQIRLASDGKQSIRDFLLVLLKRNKEIKAVNPGANLTPDDFIKSVAGFLPEKQVRQEVETYMLKGTPLNFREIKLIDGLNINYQGNIPVLSIRGDIDIEKALSW